ncbi:MAG: hypothetical protein IJ668_08385 [Selenomonadaceae bacterium]|nr:hypothetical protein [Selenomonadaceae bacterium]
MSGGLMQADALKARQEDILRRLLVDIERKYLTDANTRALKLSGDARKRSMLEVIELTRQHIDASLRVKQLRRAQRFILALNAFCKRCFKEKAAAPTTRKTMASFNDLMSKIHGSKSRPSGAQHNASSARLKDLTRRVNDANAELSRLRRQRSNADTQRLIRQAESKLAQLKKELQMEQRWAGSR